MEVELEFTINEEDKTVILPKLIEIIKVAQQQGFEIKEIEFEEEEEE